jgi:hypothetical protein
MRHSVLRQPIGVVAAFSPWKFPVSSPAREVGGALSAGCSIILKVSEETPAGAVQRPPESIRLESIVSGMVRRIALDAVRRWWKSHCGAARIWMQSCGWDYRRDFWSKH